ncbi:MAG TPA: hypothetical protein VNV36_06165 [Pseudomonas sp.]|uniref:hypothetical protein n=1 Tax=Pseudomonas sp. TaxID=306 RepID=UPI002B5F3B4D|nr:hypothetical protein [Pseudomonas sp.]HWH86340.1 hypothetical protein [Pseudomonas sp.]
MTQINLWELLGTAGAFVVAMFAMLQIILRNFYKHLDGRFLTLEKELESVRKLEEWLHQLRAELPRHYVMREDYIRDRAAGEARVDALAKYVYSVGKENRP